MLRPLHVRRLLKNNKTVVLTPKHSQTIIITTRQELRNIIIKTMKDYQNPLVESTDLSKRNGVIR